MGRQLKCADIQNRRADYGSTPQSPKTLRVERLESPGLFADCMRGFQQDGPAMDPD